MLENFKQSVFPELVSLQVSQYFKMVLPFYQNKKIKTKQNKQKKKKNLKNKHKNILKIIYKLFQMASHKSVNASLMETKQARLISRMFEYLVPLRQLRNRSD